MCTALRFCRRGHYFGRNLDLEYRYNESVTVTPRNYLIRYKSGEIDRRHYAIIGMATVIDGYPLYYDATNEFGLSIAALNFEGNALYTSPNDSSIKLAPYELALYLLGRCRNLIEAKKLLNSIYLIDLPYKDEIPNSELHWMIGDQNSSIVIEFSREGKKIYDNPIDVLTNNPPFDFHLNNINNYINLTRDEPQNRFSEDLKLERISRGLGAMGMPGDNSSASRFVRAAFTMHNSECLKEENSELVQFFHMLRSVEQAEGSVKTKHGFERTQYSSCCDMDKGIYYYTTYNNFEISAVDMKKENLESETLMSYRIRDEVQIKYIN